MRLSLVLRWCFEDDFFQNLVGLNPRVLVLIPVVIVSNFWAPYFCRKTGFDLALDEVTKVAACWYCAPNVSVLFGLRHYLLVMLNTFGCWLVRLLDIVVIGWVTSGQFVPCLLEELNISDISVVEGYLHGYPVNVSSLFRMWKTGFIIDLLFGEVPYLTTFQDDPNWLARVKGSIMRASR
jgi:hypothetical protein